MALSEEQDESAGIPEWVVTFGDMMSLLLTFFIMLVSMSEIKQEEKYQAMVESMRRRFGHDTTVATLAPGDTRPRNSPLKHLATMGRARRANTMRGGDKVRAPVGDNPRVRAIRAGDQTVVGGVIYFDEHDAELTEEHKQQLQITAERIGGKPQKIEIRGHTTSKPVPKDSLYSDNWHLAFARCRKALDFLVELGMDRQRLRISVAADNEPVHSGLDPIERLKNSRVEVVMLNVRVEDLHGEPDEP